VKLLEDLSADFTKENPVSTAGALPAAQIAKYVKRLYLMYPNNCLEEGSGSLDHGGPSPQSVLQLAKNCVNIEELQWVPFYFLTFPYRMQLEAGFLSEANTF